MPEGHGAAVLSPANSEGETGMSKSGNWVYPSEKMFFDAMKRKGYASAEKDMKMVVPIHNAVNERAWKEIKEWERPWGSEEKYVLHCEVLDGMLIYVQVWWTKATFFYGTLHDAESEGTVQYDVGIYCAF